MNTQLRCGSGIGWVRLAPVAGLLILGLLTAPVMAQISTETISVTNGGSLTYSVASLPLPCGTSLKQPLPEYDRDTYSNFVYTSVAGVQTDLTGSVQFLQNTSTSLGVCAFNTPTSVSLDGGGYLVQFTPGGNGIFGSAVLQTPVGYLNPKYVILGVTYAPPGPSSFVQYTTTTFFEHHEFDDELHVVGKCVERVGGQVIWYWKLSQRQAHLDQLRLLHPAVLCHLVPHSERPDGQYNQDRGNCERLQPCGS